MEGALLLRDMDRDDQSTSDVETGDEPWVTRYHGTRFRTNFLSKKRRYSRMGLYILGSLAVLLFLGAYLVLRGLQISGRSIFWHQHEEEKAVFDEFGNLIQHPQYIVFEPPRRYSSSSLIDVPLRPVRRLPDRCLDAHFTLGEPCYDDKPSTFDLVWTWVNASDWRLVEEMRKALEEVQLPTSDKQAGDSKAKLYRDHDELRHSFRSVLSHFRPYIRKFHLFTSDFPFSQDSYTLRVTNVTDEANRTVSNLSGSPHVIDIPNNSTIRLGQLPSWLRSQDQGRWRDGDVQLEVAYQSQVFRKFSGLSFNSFGIETQLPHLRDIEYNIIYLNDDFYFTADLIPADFYTSGTYGTVLRFDVGFLIDPDRVADADPAGEWGPLKYTSWLLSERFGYRSRPYAKHAAKSVPMAILDEAAHIWEKELKETASHRFRGMRGPETGLWDVHTTFMLPHIIVERWREALLWSWVIGKIGGMNDEWTRVEKNQAWAELGGLPSTSKIHVHLSKRGTLENDRVMSVLAESGEGMSTRTRYDFSNLDGYPYGFKDENDRTVLPKFTNPNVSREVCVIDYDECFSKASSASEAFKTIAFDRLKCGDCIIHALREKSGELGLSAFLPSPDRKFNLPESTLWSGLFDLDNSNNEKDTNNNEKDVPSDTDSDSGEEDEEQQSSPSSSPINDLDELEDEPHLPLDNNWRNAKFALKDVLDLYGNGGTVKVRQWVERVLERYRFIIGDSHVLFLMIEGPEEARRSLGGISKEVALLCMNDDVKRGFWETDRILRDWQDRRWSTSAEWERS
ncbi:hypothetical protein Clacol_002370 [Clathrus columnatus]|uniref:Stealth protein CR3 conserved region 3 domain-containing protein n=1 Tax=Clathrus columnatus TaxID=1419009 RepID=A0AAV5A0K9_9AGAM|nr:hypothetical protein Clacol_002370 [Clathrus columnatus]